MKYIQDNAALADIINREIEALADDMGENELYFYTTSEIASSLQVGEDNHIGGRKIWVSSISTRLSGYLPAEDGKLFFYTPQKEFNTAIGEGDFKRGVLVAAEWL